MKRSSSVPLIFLGTLGGLTYCQNSTDVPANTEVQVKQDFYATLDDCQRDWGTEAQNCQQALTTTTVNGQDTVSSGYAGGNTTPGSSGTTSTVYSGSSYHYSGPRYFWYRHEYGGYPMAVDPDGKTRPIIGSRIPESGAKFAVQSVNAKTSMPTHMTASKGVTRSGFGSFGRGTSAGG
jgi:hypothetical protein